MQKIPCYLAVSAIPGAGIGCFTAVNVQKGDLVWIMDPAVDRLLERKEVEELLEKNPEYETFFRSHSFWNSYLKKVCIPVDQFGYTNHSDEPNIADYYEDGLLVCRAVKDIPANKEILQNYSELPDWDGISDPLIS